ncbi:alpha/beta fold hydrolase [Aeoliella sp. ICT_H6.2]|uniref:Alpha/beta fold hydrolase n=1 Tax=Aeoliella straminimaris TaxID=2954799 RepID=A0A9X2JK53_9BACT|nr:alpha/beta fold hydrolase [Aeoliella straminimaris]MCO6045884.1 alpha/beta fold hydrolase [Aeoliella straminimaris]
MQPKPQPWRELYPFDSHWFSVPLGRVHYVDEGPHEGRPLLFVHGNPTWSFHWRGLIGPLHHRYRTVAIDHLGCGLSDKPQQRIRLEDHISHLVGLVEHLDLRDVTLVAQDWGGAIGLGAMLRVPERLSRIVLFNTGAFPPWYIPKRIAVCRAPVFGRLAVQGLNAFTRAALSMTLARRAALAPEVANGYLDTTRGWSNRRQTYEFVVDIPMKKSHPTWQTLDRIDRRLASLADRPAMLVWGMKDWCFRPDCLKRFKEAWPNAEVHRLDDVGHWVVEDAPEEALKLATEFLARTDSENPR